MKKYESYKESNKIAIGLIPLEWSVTSIKNILEIPITDGPHTTPEFYDDGIPFLSAEAVKKGKLDFNRKRGFINQEDFELYSQKYLPKRGDIFMVKSGATTGNTAMVETDDIFNIWSPLAVFRANSKKVFPKFLHYYLMSPNFKSLVEVSWSYGTQQNIGMGVLSNLPISYSSIKEQTQIAKYLDHKTTIIDALIDKKEQLIKKLQAQRQAIINEAVTKGLNKNTKMKNSGIEWLGEIPEHWSFTNISFVAHSNRYSITGGPFGSDLKQEEYTDEGVRIIQLQNIGVGEFRNDYKIYTSEEKADELLSCNIYPGELIIAKMADPVARACIVPSFDRRYIMASDGIRFEVDENKCLTKFLEYAINSKYLNFQAELKSTGTTRLRIGLTEFKKFKLLLPDLKEQLQILSFIEDKGIKINKSVKLLKSQIKKLKSYRESIISEAVTGKIDVRGWQAPKK